MKILEIQREFIKNIDLKYRKFNHRTIPTARKMWGVRSPIISTLAKKVYRDDKNYVLLANKLLKSYYWEEQMLGVKLLGLACKENSERVFNLAVKNLNKVRDWGVCDTLATQAISNYSITNQNKILKLAKEKVRSKNLWARRFGIVSLLPLCLKKNKGKANVKRILGILNKVMIDKEMYVQKAIHWVLREVSWRNKQAVFNFIKKWQGKAPRSTLWQGSEKLSQTMREQLKSG